MRRVKVLGSTSDGKVLINIKPNHVYSSYSNAKGIVLTVSQEEASEIIQKYDGHIQD